jgi:hypothetical protein
MRSKKLSSEKAEVLEIDKTHGSPSLESACPPQSTSAGPSNTSARESVAKRTIVRSQATRPSCRQSLPKKEKVAGQTGKVDSLLL